ncbi:MAG: hypothetical protein QOJ44_1175 [Acidimicrobiaceae bacterium]|nr:hypothetical protein [Acidimicrobiaceae bacterium]
MQWTAANTSAPRADAIREEAGRGTLTSGSRPSHQPKRKLATAPTQTEMESYLMDIKRKFLIAGFAALPVLGAGGIAYASTPTAPVAAAPSSQSTSAAGPQVEAVGTETPDATTPGDTTPEGPSPETQSDGPGGHQDPAGASVDHQFNGQE